MRIAVTVEWDNETDVRNPGWLVCWDSPKHGAVSFALGAPGSINQADPDVDTDDLLDEARDTVRYHEGEDVDVEASIL